EVPDRGVLEQLERVPRGVDEHEHDGGQRGPGGDANAPAQQRIAKAQPSLTNERGWAVGQDRSDVGGHGSSGVWGGERGGGFAGGAPPGGRRQLESGVDD